MRVGLRGSVLGTDDFITAAKWSRRGLVLVHRALSVPGAALDGGTSHLVGNLKLRYRRLLALIAKQYRGRQSNAYHVRQPA